MNAIKLAVLTTFSLALAVGCAGRAPADPDQGSRVKENADAGVPPLNEEVSLSRSEYDGLIARLAALESATADLSAGTTRAINALGQRVAAEEAATTVVLQRLEVVEGFGPRLQVLAAASEEHAARLEASEHAIREMAPALPAITQRLASVEAKTHPLQVKTVDGRPSLVISGVNLQLLNRSGDAAADGTGNLVLGPNAFNNRGVLARGGSYNLIIGEGHDYQGVYGVAFGSNISLRTSRSAAFGAGHTLNGPNTFVFGGVQHTLNTIPHNVIVGGFANAISSGSYVTRLGGDTISAQREVVVK